MANPQQRRLDYSTPTQLQAHGVRPNLGTVMLERGWMSYRDLESKKYLLRVAWILPASKAIPRTGDPEKRTEGASQELMGWMLGQDRSTTNRDVALFCGEEAEIANFFNKQRPGIGMVNRYSVRKKADEAEPPKGKIYLRHDPEHLAARYGENFFDAGMPGASGAGRVALWTYDENVPRPVRCVCRKGQMKFNFSSNCMKCGGKGHTFDPKRKMSANSRTVLSTLQLKGIAEFGHLDITCEKLGQLCGLCENAASDALDDWEDLKVLQIIPGKVYYDRTGAAVDRAPQRILWLPGMLLDHAMVERERQRFADQVAIQRELAQLNGWAAAGIHLDRVAALHNELLRRWLMSRHSLGAFWNAMRKLIFMEGLPCGRRNQHEHDYRAYLFPFHLKD